MVRQNFPDVGEQAEIYMRVLAAAEGAPVVFRTLDIGGDKALPYLREPKDDNPAMGWRAIRIGLDRPAILRHQLRAMIRATAGQSLNLMFPMISDLAEFETARGLVDMELDRARVGGKPAAGTPVCRRHARGARAGLAVARAGRAGRFRFTRQQRPASVHVRPATGAIRGFPAATTRFRRLSLR